MKSFKISAGLLAVTLGVTAVPVEAGVIIREVYYNEGRNAFSFFSARDSGTYIISAAGGEGGGHLGGAGAIMTASFNLNQGDNLLMLIGAAGAGLDGGGGTFIVANDGRFNNLYLAAGGGGGSSRFALSHISNTVGGDANFTTDGDRGGSSLDGERLAPPAGGNGGAGGWVQNDFGTGGGGWSGSSYPSGHPLGTYGVSFAAVWQSEQDSRTGVPTKYNSGRGLVSSGGGGGGFSGGGAGNNRKQLRNGSDYDYGGGGGGGSFVAGFGTLNSTEYNRTGNGFVRISFIDRIAPPPPPIPGVPEPSTWAMLIIGFGMCGAAMRGRRMGGQLSYR